MSFDKCMNCGGPKKKQGVFCAQCEKKMYGNNGTSFLSTLSPYEMWRDWMKRQQIYELWIRTTAGGHRYAALLRERQYVFSHKAMSLLYFQYESELKNWFSDTPGETVDELAVLYGIARCVQYNFVSAYMKGKNVQSSKIYVATRSDAEYIQLIENEHSLLNQFFEGTIRKRAERLRMKKIFGYLILGQFLINNHLRHWTRKEDEI